MYRNKKDVDKHVESLMSILSPKEFKTRAYSIARLYYEVGDFASCRSYVEQYLTHKDNNAVAHKLLGQALNKLGVKEKAIEQFKISLDIDPTQTSLILDICELLAEDEISIDIGRAKYWCEKAEASFPKHPVTFALREKLVSFGNSDPKAVIKLLQSEISNRPKDTTLHARLLKHYLQANNIKEAFDHSCNVEFGKTPFFSNNAWYETLAEILKHKSLNVKDWLYQLLFLTVKERLCSLSLTETPSGNSKNLIDCCELLHQYDQSIESFAKAGVTSGYDEFHKSLLHFHRGQFAFHAATFILKKAKKDQLSWRDAIRVAAPLMLIAWHSSPITDVDWLSQAPDKQKVAVNRWSLEAAYRCSQAGHYILSNTKEKYQTFLDQISQYCSGNHWKDKLYETIFTSRDHLSKIKTSHFISTEFSAPNLRLPRSSEVEAYDNDAQRYYGNSLHHFVWLLSTYKKYSHFKCTLFEILSPKSYNYTNCGPETLNKLDVYTFLYCAAISSSRPKDNQKFYNSTKEMPTILPANITDLLCTLPQMKWWDCACKFINNELGSELTDIRATLSCGIEVVRCIDNHGLDCELLCILGSTFNDLAALAKNIEEKSNLLQRATLYFKSALPDLEKLKSKLVVKVPKKRLFDYSHKELSNKEINSLIEDAKLNISINYINETEFEKAIELLSTLTSPKSYFHISEAYFKMALEESFPSKNATISEARSKQAMLISKAKHFADRALDTFKETENNKRHLLLSEIHELIESIEAYVNKLDLDISNVNDVLNKYSSDENVSLAGSEREPVVINSFRYISSTPKHQTKSNLTNYRSAIDSQIIDTTRFDQQCMERIENQIKSLQRKDSTINDFMEQTKEWFDENRKLGNQIINTINSNIQNTTDQFKLLKISIDQVKDQIDECRNECKDVGELKKQIAELKKEVNKLKKASDQARDENGLLEEDYGNSDSTSSFAAQMPFAAQLIPPFNQRMMPPIPIPNPYQLYSQNLYNMYNQYSQFAQTAPVAPAAPPIFDTSKTQVNYPGVYTNPDQMYLDVAHLIPPPVPPVSSGPVMPQVQSSIPIVSSGQIQNTHSSTKSDVKEVSRSLPVNVVITSSDPLPTLTSGPAPVLSVTIPSKHIKGSPHNYQIAMPTTNETKVIPPPVFSFPNSASKNGSVSPILNWNQANVFKSHTTPSLNISDNLNSSKTDEASRSVTDGPFSVSTHDSSLNKSRTLSERSNTSIDNYDPCPDFKPIIPLPAEVKVNTGEENEEVIFCARAKLFRFVDKQWKERGLGEMKLLKHKVTNKVRVLMRREQIHKICANHIITPDMEIKPMKNEAKAYFWIANDFADETVVLEKFCIRFKTPETAKLFYGEFEKARLESSKVPLTITSNNTSKKEETTQVKTVDLSKAIKTSTTEQPEKTVVGGFTFNTTPTFKFVPDTQKSVESEPVTTKVNVFGGLTFKTSTSTPFSNLFTSTSNQDKASSIQSEETSKLNTSDHVEEFEPTVEFKPVVPLPALVETKTGEEEEVILFEHRAKLLRFDSATKEWKERGLGNIKLLVHKDSAQKLRLLMRRDQVMKVCCNHAVTKELTFQKMPNLEKAVSWCAKDFSEGELTTETFCLRFKTVEACDDFIKAVKLAQSKLKDESKAAKEEQNAAKQNTQVGFGNTFKPKSGSWSCTSCYTNNLENFLKCACCDQPKPQSSMTAPNSTQNAVQRTTNLETSKNSVITSNWGDRFKPNPNSWECKECLIRNHSDVDQCSACNSPKDPSKPKKEISTTTATKFSFGIPSQTPTSILTKPDTNTSLVGQLKLPTTELKETPKFNFGMPCVQETTPKLALGDQSAQRNLFGPEKPANMPITFGLKESETSVITTTPTKPVIQTNKLLTDSNTSTPFATKESGSFDFVFKPKTQKAKSPLKTPKSENGEESDDNEYASEDEGHHLQFTPVIPLPDKVDVVTGEENEQELYTQRAKLFIFTSNEWKERGIGDVKILKHKESGKLRVVMRREQVLKICLNHLLSPEITYTHKEDKAWLFVANDYSEGELVMQSFCLRFKSKEIAEEFKSAIDAARDGTSLPLNNVTKTSNDGDDVVFINEIQATAEEKQKAKGLMLPENFYTYKEKEPCKGCRGCDSDNNESGSTDKSSVQPVTPIRPLNSLLQSPATSIYGTPNTGNKTLNMFRTPLESINSNKTFSSPSFNSSINNTITDNKENTLVQTPNNCSVSSEQNSIFRTPQTSSIFGGNTSATPISSKASILAEPKLSYNEVKQDNSDAKSLFASAQNSISEDTKTSFGSLNLGTQSNKSIFDFSSQVKSDSNQKEAITPIFGDTNQKPVNPTTLHQIFSGNSQGSIFGQSVLKNNEGQSGGNIFGSKLPAFGGNSTFNEKPFSSSIFGSTDNKNTTSIFGIQANQNKPDMISSNATKEESNRDSGKGLFSTETNLFAALSSSEISFNQKKADFKWEGTGQQLFGGIRKAAGSGAGNKEENADDTEEAGAGADDEYDPHYEPIVPLPDKIIVTTGEEDEEKMFDERCKLYRFDENTREWKERGVGQLKILYHPERKTYRLLLRREQVHKVVLNMLLLMDLELLPMKKSEKAWTWSGRNYAEITAGEQELLAVKFQSVKLANTFKEKIDECVKKLQAAGDQTVQETEGKPFESVAPLRLPKHLEMASRADDSICAQSQKNVGNSGNSNGEASIDFPKQVHFEEQAQDEEGDEYEHEYDHHEDYEGYYNEEEEETGAFFSCDGEAVIRQGDMLGSCPSANVQVVFDQEIYSPKILVTDASTGEILADMLIHTDTEFQMSGDSCTWSGTDFTSNDPVEKTVTINFEDSETAYQFYNSVETSKGATFNSTDPDDS